MPQAPQIGLYKVYSTYYENSNLKMPMGIVAYKAIDWTNPDNKPRHIRLRALYYEDSIGPKKEYPVQMLDLLIIKIIALHEIPDPQNPDKIKYSIEWDIIKPEGYDDYIQEEQQILGDLILQQRNDEFVTNEHDCIAFEESQALEDIIKESYKD